MNESEFRQLLSEAVVAAIEENYLSDKYNSLKDKLKGGVKGFKRGSAEMAKQDKQSEEFGIEQRRASSDRVDPRKNNEMQKQFALVRDIQQDVKQDVEKFNLKKKTVDNALKYVTNDINYRPQTYNLEALTEMITKSIISALKQ